ncbi:MAG: NUDIX hydrolase [Desulfobacterales bacterium]|nr:NUDIX hydrolase [Desulfobacterales bacterium]
MYSKQNNYFYPQFPQVAVGSFVFKENKILLVKRKNPPSEGIWAIPGGKVKLGETLKVATERETKEETSVIIHAGDPIFTFDFIESDNKGNIRYHYVIVDLIGDYISGIPHAGDDALEAGWITEKEIKKLQVSSMTRKVLEDHFGFGK